MSEQSDRELVKAIRELREEIGGLKRQSRRRETALAENTTP